MSKIYFLAEANEKVGYGHVFRAMALAEMFYKIYDCIFLLRKGVPKFIHTYIESKVKKTIVIDNINDKAKLESFIKPNNLIVLDGYSFNSEFQLGLKTLDCKIILISDFSEQPKHVDAIIDHSPEKKKYKSNKNVLMALGPKYSLLRPIFRNMSTEPGSLNSIKKCFVCFGGADPYELSIKATEALLLFEEIENISIVTQNYEKINKKFKSETRVKIYTNLTEIKMAKLMKESDLAIAPASTLLFEICAVKTPILSGYFTDNQKSIYNGMANIGAIFPIGDITVFQKEDFKKNLTEIFKNIEILKQIIENQNKMFSGSIKERYLEFIGKVIAK